MNIKTIPTDFSESNYAALEYASGTLTMGGLTLNSGSVTTIELAGAVPGSQFDQLHVTGSLSLGGTLQVALIDSFSPPSGLSFDILDCGSLAGTISALQLPTLGGGLAWALLFRIAKGVTGL